MGQARRKWVKRAVVFIELGGAGRIGGRGHAARFTKLGKLAQHVPAAQRAMEAERVAKHFKLSPRSVRQAGQKASRGR